MSKHTATSPSDLLEHTVAQLWLRLQPGLSEPEHIEILQKRRKGTVYRLHGAGHQGTAVIAKRSWLAKAQTERAIYEQILPRLAIPSLSYYGFVEEGAGEYGWLFLACAGDEEYSPYVEEHCALAARWLGLIHTSSVEVAVTVDLPDRGPNYYLKCLRSAHRAILSNLTNSVLTADDIAVLKTVVQQCEVIASRWDQVERVCQKLPWTLIHGDFAPKNMRIRSAQGSIELLPFDWGSAGWGSIAADLAQRGIQPNTYWAGPDLSAYYAVARESWPHLKMHDVELLAVFGKIFRCLVCIDLDAQNLATPWIEKCMLNMRVYMRDMAESIQTARRLG